MSDAKGGLCLVVDDGERFRADLKLLDVRGGENELAHSKRLAPYADRAMQQFAKAACGPTLYPSSPRALFRRLMHWSKQNG